MEDGRPALVERTNERNEWREKTESFFSFLFIDVVCVGRAMNFTTARCCGECIYI